MPLDPADREALSRVLSIQPAWTGIVQAAEATNIRDKMLLHSGPPLKTTPVTPILNSAAVACVFEGWAQSLAEADELLASGEVAFAAAQDFNVATPLAAVVSPIMNLIEMTDLKIQCVRRLHRLMVAAILKFMSRDLASNPSTRLTIYGFLMRKLQRPSARW